MGFLDWVFKQRYDTEKELLRALLDHTENWYNEITEPLKPLLFEMINGRTELMPEKYVEIAQQLYFNKIESNHGNYLRNTMEQMSEYGIPLFTSRDKLRTRTQDFLDSGRFLKDIVICLYGWHGLEPHTQYENKKKIREEWEIFRGRKEKLVSEINRQIRRLG